MKDPGNQTAIPPLDLTEKLAATRILVLGDLILDHYLIGATDRVSPEAPVPVVLLEREHEIPGGAANVARNTAAIGASTTCVGIIGDDDPGRRLLAAMASLHIACDAVTAATGRPTTVKTRVISHGQQMLRLDRETSTLIDDPTGEHLLEAIRSQLPRHDALIISDYGKGVLTRSLLSSVIAAARQSNVPVFVDPKGTDYARYKGATALTPNTREALAAAGISAAGEDGLAPVADRIVSVAQPEFLVITRGSEGFALFRQGNPSEEVPASAREIFDVTGAGDTFVAFLAMAIAAGFDPLAASRIANAAAGVVVGKVGAATVAPWELRAALAPGARGRKLRAPHELQALGEELRAAHRRVVFTNGCFDFLHAGHVAMLQQARQLGDALVLATNTDDVIARLKGSPRPIVKQDQRETLLAAIEAVDFVVPFSDLTPHDLIRALRPDILVKGDNYGVAEVEGREIVEQYGGTVVLLPTLESINTAQLVSRSTGKPGPAA